jgi:hypothetical protein
MKGDTLRRIVGTAREHPDWDWVSVVRHVLIEIENEQTEWSGIGA